MIIDGCVSRGGSKCIGDHTTDHTHTILYPAAKRYQMLVDDEDDATDALVTTLTREEQQTENKSWQDVMDVPTKRKAETSGILEQMRECHDTSPPHVQMVRRSSRQKPMKPSVAASTALRCAHT